MLIKELYSDLPLVIVFVMWLRETRSWMIVKAIVVQRLPPEFEFS